MSVVYRDMIMPDAVIHMNGTRVVAEGNVLFEHLMDKERLRALLEYGDVHGISLGVSRRERIIISTRRAWSAWTGFAGVFRSAISWMDGNCWICR